MSLLLLVLLLSSICSIFAGSRQLKALLRIRLLFGGHYCVAAIGDRRFSFAVVHLPVYFVGVASAGMLNVLRKEVDALSAYCVGAGVCYGVCWLPWLLVWVLAGM